MEGIHIPESETVSLDAVARGVVGLRLLLVNLYAVRHEDRTWTLVDAGLYLSADRVRRWTVSHFEDRRPEAIILTHGHFDHVGSLKTLADGWNVPVYVHALELPYVTGQRQYPPPDPKVGGGMMSVLSPLYPRGPIDLGNRIRALPDDGSVPSMPGWRWVHTPGHTDGHVSFFRTTDRTLLVGDAFCTTDQESFLAIMQQKPELHGPPAYYTSDWDAARVSVEKLAGLRPLVVAPGHGQPMAGGDLPERLDQFAADFDRIARPKHGRYAA